MTSLDRGLAPLLSRAPPPLREGASQGGLGATRERRGRRSSLERLLAAPPRYAHGGLRSSHRNCAREAISRSLHTTRPRGSHSAATSLFQPTGVSCAGATGGHAASGWGIGEPAAGSPLPPLHVSGAGGWVDGGATPQPLLRLVPPTPLQQLEQHQARQEDLQQRRQSERGMLGGLMHQQRLEHHAAPEPEPEPEPAAAPNGAAPAQQQLQDWSVAQIVSWVAETMKLPAVAEAAAQEEVDGATAIEMGKEEWKELGSSGVKAAKLVGALKKLAAVQ